MAVIIPESVHFERHKNDMFVCDGCTYNKGPACFYPKTSVICALASLEGNDPIVWRARWYPCGYVNPSKRHNSKGRPLPFEYVG